MTFIHDYVKPYSPPPGMDGQTTSLGKLLRALPNREVRVVEDPHLRELFEGMYRLRRGHWDIAELPDPSNPPEFNPHP